LKQISSSFNQNLKFFRTFQSQFIEIYGSYNKEELISYYHLIHFIQILIFIEHLNRRNSIFSLNYWCDPDFLTFYWVKSKNVPLENENTTRFIKNFPKIKAGNLLKKLNEVFWLKPEFLKFWIRLESIWTCELFAPIDVSMKWDGPSDCSRSEFMEKLEFHYK